MYIYTYIIWLHEVYIHLSYLNYWMYVYCKFIWYRCSVRGRGAEKGGRGGARPPSQSQKCSYQGPYLNFFSWGPRPPQPPRLALHAPPPWKFTFLRPWAEGGRVRFPSPPPAPNPSLPVLMCLNLCLPPPAQDITPRPPPPLLQLDSYTYVNSRYIDWFSKNVI